MLTEPEAMTPEAVDKLREGIKWMNDQMFMVSPEWKRRVAELWLLFPPKPKPEAAPGPYLVERSTTNIGRYQIRSTTGHLIAHDIPDEPTARVLASGPGSVKLLERLRDCLAVKMDGGRERGIQIDAARTMIVEHLEGDRA